VSAQFQHGELVNIAIYNARFDSGNDYAYCFDLDDDHSVEIPRLAAHFERVAPKEWPPVAGDVWEGGGIEWFATQSHGDDVWLTPSNGATPRRIGDVLANPGPLKLLRRRGWHNFVTGALEAVQ
jgi:hypothetical protein